MHRTINIASTVLCLFVVLAALCLVAQAFLSQFIPRRDHQSTCAWIGFAGAVIAPLSAWTVTGFVFGKQNHNSRLASAIVFVVIGFFAGARGLPQFFANQNLVTSSVTMRVDEVTHDPRSGQLFTATSTDFLDYPFWQRQLGDVVMLGDTVAVSGLVSDWGLFPDSVRIWRHGNPPLPLSN